ncbi:MAG: exodeoxyribonuclease VII small subunit [bacterium]
MTKKKSDKQEFSFEPAMERLEELVGSLESGELSLEESLAAFEEGINLVRQCRDYLEGAKQRVEVLLSREGAEGSPEIEPYEEDVEEED